MMFGRHEECPDNELEAALKRQRDIVTNEILNSDANRARREIQNRVRKGTKAQAFNRKNRRRNKRKK